MYVTEEGLKGILESESVLVEYSSTASFFFQKYGCQFGEVKNVVLPDVFNGIALQKGNH